MCFGDVFDHVTSSGTLFEALVSPQRGHSNVKEFGGPDPELQEDSHFLLILRKFSGQRGQ